MSELHTAYYRKLKPPTFPARQWAEHHEAALGAWLLDLLWRERWRVSVGGRDRQVWTGVDYVRRVVTIETDPILTGLACPWPRPKDLEHGRGEGGQG